LGASAPLLHARLPCRQRRALDQRHDQARQGGKTGGPERAARRGVAGKPQAPQSASAPACRFQRAGRGAFRSRLKARSGRSRLSPQSGPELGWRIGRVGLSR